MAPQIILMPFVWKLFVEASHVPMSYAKCWASLKPLCLLHSPWPTVQADEGALNANEGTAGIPEALAWEPSPPPTFVAKEPWKWVEGS